MSIDKIFLPACHAMAHAVLASKKTGATPDPFYVVNFALPDRLRTLASGFALIQASMH